MLVEPEDKELWSRFRACERNEMIITKSGRCLFPVLKLRIVEDEEGNADSADFEASSLISYALTMERIDQYKWKYRDGHWYHLPSNAIFNLRSTDGGESDLHIYEPECSPTTWQQIQFDGLNFSKVKLTNRKGSHHNNFGTGMIANHRSNSNNQSSNFFSLCSFGNYVPVVYLCDWCKFRERHDTEIGVPVKLSHLFQKYSPDDLVKEGSVKKIKVDECSFIAVTHYQNSLITHLKKHNNPHAKGFILSDEGIGRMPTYMTRGKPGRKRHTPLEANESIAHQPQELPYDVFLASLALEKMSSGSIPRSEIVTLSPAPEEVVRKTIKWSTFGEENKNTEKSEKFWGYYRK